MEIKFRPIDILDLDKLLLHRNQVETRRWLENESIIEKNEQKNWFSKGGAKDFLIIIYNNTDIGLSRVKKINDKLMQVGLDIFSEYRGLGLASKSFDALINKHCREVLQFELWVFLDNLPAIHVYMKNGFKIDNTEPVKYLQRSWCESNKKFKYIRMIFNRLNSS